MGGAHTGPSPYVLEANRLRRGTEPELTSIEQPVHRAGDRAPVRRDGRKRQEPHPAQPVDEALGCDPPVGRDDPAQMPAGLVVAGVEQVL